MRILACEYSQEHVANDSGSSILEVLVGITLLAVIVLGLARVVVASQGGYIKSSTLTTAVTLAQDKIEDIEKLPFDSLVGVAGVEDFGTITGAGEYKRETTITDDPDGLDMKEVEVRVTSRVDNRQSVLFTLVARQGKDALP